MARYWDTSAIVLLVVEQKHSRGSRDFYRDDPVLIVWQFSKTEVVSALTRLARTADIDEDGRDEGMGRLDHLAKQWTVVRVHSREEVEALEASARALMRRHPLKASDALQLAAALDFFELPRGRGFVAVDGTLSRAAGAEGFTLFYPEAPRKGGRQRR